MSEEVSEPRPSTLSQDPGAPGTRGWPRRGGGRSRSPQDYVEVGRPDHDQVLHGVVAGLPLVAVVVGLVMLCMRPVRSSSYVHLSRRPLSCIQVLFQDFDAQVYERLHEVGQ